VRSVILDDFDLKQALALLRDQVRAQLGYSEALPDLDTPVAANA